MPYKRFYPAPESDMDKQMKNDNTICNTLRAIYHMTANSEIRLKCRLAFSMGKKMCERLMYYHDKYNTPAKEFTEFTRRDPAPEWEMDKSRWEGHHSVCQTIRDIYHMTSDVNLQLECRIAMTMTKAMHEKLKAYKIAEENTALAGINTAIQEVGHVNNGN